MEYIDCINRCLENARTPQGKILMEKMRSDVQWYRENFQDDPQRLSGWGRVPAVLPYIAPGASLPYLRQGVRR